LGELRNVQDPEELGISGRGKDIKILDKHRVRNTLSPDDTGRPLSWRISKVKKTADYCIERKGWCMNESYDCPETKLGIYPNCLVCPKSIVKEYKNAEPIKPLFYEKKEL
jgi:hypothetical protein